LGRSPAKRIAGSRKVGIASLPTLTGDPGHGALGGYEIAVHPRVPPEKRDLAFALAAHLTSLEPI